MGAREAGAEVEKAALEVVQRFIDTFNARDTAAHRATLHYPHVRLASGEVAIARTPEEYAPRFDFARFAEATGWHHSTLDSAEVIQSFPDKVHVAVQFSRWRADGSRIGVYHAIYVVTKQGQRFGIQCRSSTAP
jgi:hypothetical protein